MILSRSSATHHGMTWLISPGRMPLCALSQVKRPDSSHWVPICLSQSVYTCLSLCCLIPWGRWLAQPSNRGHVSKVRSCLPFETFGCPNPDASIFRLGEGHFCKTVTYICSVVFLRDPGCLCIKHFIQPQIKVL